VKELETVFGTFRLPKDLAIDVKTRAVREQRSYSDVVTEALHEFMTKDKEKKK
jgi:hypothetical protein